jgi:hypothetical protein
VIELVGIAEKTIVTGRRTAFLPVGQLFPGGRVEMQKIEGGPSESPKRTWLLDQPFPNTNASLGRFPKRAAIRRVTSNRLQLGSQGNFDPRRLCFDLHHSTDAGYRA